LEEYNFNPVVVYEYAHPDNKDYRLEITDFGEDLSPRYEAWIFTGSGIGSDTTCLQEDDYSVIKQEATEILDSFIERDLTDESYESEEYEGYTLLVSDKLPVVNILNCDGVLIEAMFKENNSTEDLFLVGKNYVDSLINKENK
jgi:hypothetical protein